MTNVKDDSQKLMVLKIYLIAAVLKQLLMNI